MTDNTTNSSALQSEAETAGHLLDDWFDPIDAGLRDRVREFIQAMIEAELEVALSRPRYAPAQRRLARMLMARAASLAIGMATVAVAAGDLRPGRDRSAARQARYCGGQDKRVEEHSAAGLPRANQAGRFADCRRLSCRNQYASGAPGAFGRVWRCDQ
jgi:hypothetical protein